MRGTDLWTLGVIVGLALVTVLTRCFFFILDRIAHCTMRRPRRSPA